MSEFKINKIDTTKPRHDSLSFGSKGIHANLTALRFVDNDTKQVVFFIPSLDITGYGESNEKALQILNFSLDEFFKYLSTQAPKRKKIELENLGWKKSWIRNSEYSNIHVDEEGKLQGFSILDNKIEKLELEAA